MGISDRAAGLAWGHWEGYWEANFRFLHTTAACMVLGSVLIYLLGDRGFLSLRRRMEYDTHAA